jgi:hypothetical protein
MTERTAIRLRSLAIDVPIQQTSGRLDHLLHASQICALLVKWPGIAASYSDAGDRGCVASGPRLAVCLIVERMSRSAKVSSGELVVGSSLPSPLPFMRAAPSGYAEHGCWGAVDQSLHTQLSDLDDRYRPVPYVPAEPIHHRPQLDKYRLQPARGDIGAQHPAHWGCHDPTSDLSPDRVANRQGGASQCPR